MKKSCIMLGVLAVSVAVTTIIAYSFITTPARPGIAESSAAGNTVTLVLAEPAGASVLQEAAGTEDSMPLSQMALVCIIPIVATLAFALFVRTGRFVIMAVRLKAPAFVFIMGIVQAFGLTGNIVQAMAFAVGGFVGYIKGRKNPQPQLAAGEA